MILPVHAVLRHHLQRALSQTFGLADSQQPAIVIETPPRRALGDLAVPVAFELARRLRKAPRAIAQELVSALGEIPGVTRIDAAPNGYLNFYLDRRAFVLERLGQSGNEELGKGGNEGLAGKVIVEHTAINPNKAAHIGHLRNSALGDTLVRLLRFRGRQVEVQNYIDDTGVQVADVVIGFTKLEERNLEGIRALADDPSVRFDYHCWDLYAKVTEWYEADTSRLQVRAEAMHAIEAGGNPLAEMGALVADRVVRCHLKTMARMNVDYDLLTWEGDIIRLQFWAKAFEELKTLGAVFLQTEGRLAGCWVMKIDEADAASTDEAGGGDEDPEHREKVIVRSNGTVTYVGKDIANQFWKFGLLGQDFFYRVFEERAGRPLWATSSAQPDGGPAPPPFGRATAVYNVIDSRQAYLQQLLKQSLGAMGFHEQAEASTHFSYEMVALSHATARELGYADTEDSGKPFVEVSGRKGLGVKADDLLDRLIATATGEVMRRQPELPAGEARAIAEAIAVSAVRYFLIKFSRTKVIAFDIQEALSFEGETGPYVQYAVVRANNIFAKLKERDGVDTATVADHLPRLSPAALTEGDEADELWNLILEASRIDELADSAIRSLEISHVAKFAFGLAQAFNAFYHRQPIMREEREDVRLWRAAAVAYCHQQLTLALNVMGISVPNRM